jgi:hypothetical protein
MPLLLCHAMPHQCACAYYSPHHVGETEIVSQGFTSIHKVLKMCLLQDIKMYHVQVMSDPDAF